MVKNTIYNKITFDISDHWSFTVGNNSFWDADHGTEINAFMG
jgi:hypothetical protein